MEEQVERLVQKTWDKYEKLPKAQRQLIAVSGIPGAGKTTFANAVTTRLNNRCSPTVSESAANTSIAVCVPLDGFHFSRSQLSAMPDPAYAHARRGAAFTFDGDAFLELVKALRLPLSAKSRTLYAPSFDHALKDPVPGDIPISVNMQVIVFEGNYLSLGHGPWGMAAALMDEIWWVEVEQTLAEKRLVERHVKAAIAKDINEAKKRVKENDLINAKEIVEGRIVVDEIISSVDDVKVCKIS